MNFKFISTLFLNQENPISIECEEIEFGILNCKFISCYSSPSKAPIFCSAKNGYCFINSFVASECKSDTVYHIADISIEEKGKFDINYISTSNCGKPQVSTCLRFSGETSMSNFNASDNKSKWEPAVKLIDPDKISAFLRYSNVINCIADITAIVSAYGQFNLIHGLNAIGCSQSAATGAIVEVKGKATIELSNFNNNKCDHSIRYSGDGENADAINCFFGNNANVERINKVGSLGAATAINVAGNPNVFKFSKIVKIKNLKFLAIAGFWGFLLKE